MKAKLPIIGQVRIGKDAEPIEVVREVVKQEKFFDVLGGLVEFSSNKLSGETSISNKILKANKGWVYRNNDVIAQEVSKMEFELYSIGLSKGEIVYNEIESHPLIDLLDNPCEELTGSEFIYIIQSHRKLAGESFVLKQRQGNKIVALRPIIPDKIELLLQAPTAEDPTVVVGYKYTDVIDGKKIVVTYRPEDIIHIKKPNPNNQFRGLGAVEPLADTIDLDNLTTETSKKFFQNGAITNVAFSTESQVTDEQLKRLKAEMKSTYGGASNAYKAMILGGGLKPVNMSFTNQQMQFLEQLQWYRDKIMYGFGNTKASLGMIDDVNRASHEGSIIEWQRNTVKPDMAAICDAFNEFLVPEFGESLVLGFCDPVPEDRADDISEVRDLFPIGIMTLNEARDMLDLDPVDGGDDQFYQPQSTPQDQTTNPSDGEDQ